jgi:hypothetical protein
MGGEDIVDYAPWSGARISGLQVRTWRSVTPGRRRRCSRARADLAEHADRDRGHRGEVAPDRRGVSSVTGAPRVRRAMFYGWRAPSPAGDRLRRLGQRFLPDRRLHPGVSRAALEPDGAPGATICAVVVGAVSVVSGRVIDGMGRASLAAGGLALAAGVSGWAGGAWQVYLFDGLMAAGFACTSSTARAVIVGSSGGVRS